MLGVKANYLSIVIGSLYFLVTLFMSAFLVGTVLSFSQTIGTMLVLFIWLSPGYVVAAIAQQHVVLHASVAGALCCSLAIGAIYAFEIDGFTGSLGYSWFVAAVVCFGFGALVWSLKSWWVKKNN